MLDATRRERASGKTLALLRTSRGNALELLRVRPTLGSRNDFLPGGLLGRSIQRHREMDTPREVWT